MITIRRAVTRTGSAGALLLLLAGIPAGLVHFVGSPLPTSSPTWTAISSALTHPVSDQLLIDAAALAVWLLWLLLVVSIVVESIAAVRGVSAPRPLLLRPIQVVAAALVAGLSAGILAPTVVTPLHSANLAPPSVIAAPASIPDTAPIRLVSLAYPAVTPATTPTHDVSVEPAAAAVYVVVHGDWAVGVADRFLGDADRYGEIAALNPQLAAKYGSHDPAFPDHIEPGDTLRLPVDAYDRGIRAHASGDLVPPATAQPSNQPVTEPVEPTAPTPSPQQGTTAPGRSAPATTPAPAPTATAPGITASPTDAPARAENHHDDGPDRPLADADHSFVEVAGGFITAALAAGLLFAAAMVWRRRRHRYRPTPITSPVLDDPDLAPPLAALTQLRQTLRRRRPDLLNTPALGPTVREYVGAEVKPDLPPSGPTGTELAGLARLPVSAGLGLTGPGALDAARGLLVASLTAGGADHPDEASQVVIPASTLATLLGVSAVDLPAMRRLVVTAHTGDAITHIEEEIIRRTRVVTDHDVNDIATLRTAHPLAEPLPQLLLIADIPEPRQHHRLANAVRLGEKVDIGAALIGAWPLGVTLTITPGGNATGSDATTRVAVLDTDATVAVLAMLAEAHDDITANRVADSTTQSPAPARTADPDEAHAPPAPTVDPATSPPTASDQPSRVAVRVLGRPAIIGPDGQPMRGLRGKALELLIYLAVNRNGTSLDDILVALWPDAKVEPAKDLLSTNVGNLRTVLRAAHPALADGADTHDGDDPGGDEPRPGQRRRTRKPDPIPNTGSHYHLDPTFVAVDWWTVLDEYTKVATAGDDDSRLRHLTAAVDAVAGPLADGLNYEWMGTDREHVRRRLIKLFAHAADLASRDDPHQARVLYDHACELDPLSGDLARRAIQAAAAVGDADGIRHRLSLLRQALADNSLDLDDATEGLVTDLLRQLAPRSPDQPRP